MNLITKDMLNTKDASKYIGLSYHYLAKMRSNKVGPKYTKLGRIVYYTRHDLREWRKKQIIVVGK